MGTVFDKDHIGSPIDLASIWMRGDEAKKTVEAGHGGEGGGDLFSGEGAGGREDTRIHAAPVVQQVACQNYTKAAEYRAHSTAQVLRLGRQKTEDGRLFVR